MAPYAESNPNFKLAEMLQRMAPKSRIEAEKTGVLEKSKGLRPDILITADGRSPVVIEAEYLPAHNVENEALDRLGERVVNEQRRIEAVVALRYPEQLKNAENIEAALKTRGFQYCFFQESGAVEKPTRFPETGWLEGSINDLSELVRMITVPQKEAEQAAEFLENAIENAARVLDNAAEMRPELSKEIAHLLGMSNVPQTRRMACAILANALAFHERIAGMHSGIRPLSLVIRAPHPQDDMLETWEHILAINYYPIFAIAKDILTQLTADIAKAVLSRLRYAAQGAHITNAHELTGRVFQRLISDRKYLATFYTRPYSAALLARLAVAKLRGVNWKFRESIERLKIADFACGTGALLSAVYDQITALHEREGGNLDDLHPAMMQEVLHGADVMPSAVHITSATLSGARPDIDYGDSRVYTMPYGRQTDNTVKLGSLELLTNSSVDTLFNTTDPGKRTGRHGEETATRINVEMKDASFDLVIMNPPFTTSTNHAGAHHNIINPAFAAFNATAEDMNDMRDKMKEIFKATCYHGSAGMGSAFAALGDKKLKPGGVMALVLPLTAVSGKSWEKMRKIFAEGYSEIDILSIAAHKTDEVSFSADTDMAECLIIARKERSGGKVSVPPAARFTTLRQRPKSFAQASETAKQIVKLTETRRIEDGPYGGSFLKAGEELLGRAISMEIDRDGSNWRAARIEDYSIAQTASALTQSNLWLPGILEPFVLKTSTVS